MARILLGANRIDTQFNDNFFHLYLVYEDDSGSFFVIEGGRQQIRFGGLNLVFGVDDLNVDIDPPRTQEQIDDFYAENLNNTLIPIDLGDRNPAIVWEQMIQQAVQIRDSDIPYDLDPIVGESDNSNTVVNSVLNAVGIDLQSLIPFLNLDELVFGDVLAGSDDLFSEYADLLDVVLDGSDSFDILRGGLGEDVISGDGDSDELSGLDGSDFLSGGDGDDTLKGSSGVFEQPEIDILIGSSGADTFVLADNSQSTLNLYTDGEFDEFTGAGLSPQNYGVIFDFSPEEGDVVRLSDDSFVGFERYRFESISNEVIINSSKDVFAEDALELIFPSGGVSEALIDPSIGSREGETIADGSDGIIAIFANQTGLSVFDDGFERV